jgi:hypothetical protein
MVMGPTKRDAMKWAPRAPAPTICRVQLLPKPVGVIFLVAPIRLGAISTELIRMRLVYY